MVQPTLRCGRSADSFAPSFYKHRTPEGVEHSSEVKESNAKEKSETQTHRYRTSAIYRVIQGRFID
jgi:hypothetical protein